MKKQAAVWSSLALLILFLLPTTALAEGRYADGDGCVALGVVGAVFLFLYCLWRFLNRGVSGSKNVLILIATALPATALAEGRYTDSGCDAGGFLLLLMIVFVIAFILATIAAIVEK